MEDILSIPFKDKKKNFIKKILKKRVSFFVLISLLFFPLCFAFGAEADHLIITEIQIAGDETANDFIEIYNPTDSEIDISKFQIRKKTEKAKEGNNESDPIIEFSEGTKVNSKDYFLWANSENGYANLINADISSEKKLSSDNSIALLDNSGTKIAERKIIDAVGWGGGNANSFFEGSLFSQGINKNKSLERKRINGIYKDTNNNDIDFEINENSSPTSSDQSKTKNISAPISADAGGDVISLEGEEIAFDASNSTGDIKEYFWNFGDGTTGSGKTISHKYNFPGEYFISLKVSNEENESSVLIKITIFSSSIFISEFLPNPEGGDSGKEWAEIVNESKQIQNISGWGISDSGEKSDFTFSEGSYISPQGFLYLSSSLTKISLSNNGGSFFLFYPSGDICQEIKYGKISENWSVARKNKEYFYTENLTPGMINIVSGKTEEKKKNSSSVSPKSSFESGEILEGEVKETQSLKTPTRKLLAENLLAEANKNQNMLAFAGLSVGTFAGFFGFGLVRLRKKIKDGKWQAGSKQLAKPEKEIIEVEIENSV